MHPAARLPGRSAMNFYCFYRDCVPRSKLNGRGTSTEVSAFINASVLFYELFMHAAFCLSWLRAALSPSFHFIKQNSRQSKRHAIVLKATSLLWPAINNSSGEMAVKSINGLLLQQTEANIIIDSYRIRGAIIV